MKPLAIFLAYAALAFFTGTWAYDTYIEDTSTKMQRHTENGDTAAFSILVGLFWPVYWGGYGSYLIVHSLRHPAPTFLCKDETGKTWTPENGVCTIHVVPPNTGIPGNN